MEIPTNVLLTEVYGELGKGLGWSLEPSKIHTDLLLLFDVTDSKDISSNIDISIFMDELEGIVQQNASTLLVDLNEKKNIIQKEYIDLACLLVRILRQKTNIGRIEGACYKDIQKTTLYSGIVYFLEDGRICDNDAIITLNQLIKTHPSVKDICRKLLVAYSKTIMVTDTLTKCIIMAKMTEQIPNSNKE